MATNQYFQSNYFANTKDQVLVEDLIIESIKIYGIDVQYLPRTLINYDQLFGEDQSSAFNDAHTIEIYIKSTDGFGGDGQFLSKFGLEIREEIQITVARKRFTEEVTDNAPDIQRPREGDLLLLPSAVDSRNRIYEISFVDKEEIFYQIGNLTTWGITAKVFEYGGESFDTGIQAIDDYDPDYATATVYTLEAGADSYVIGETVSQASGFSAEVIVWDDPELTVIKRKGELVTTETLDGASASRLVVSQDSQTSGDAGADNDLLDDKEDALIDFSESNPFSE